MINMLYVVLIAMLAINISGEVLDGFVAAGNDLERNIEQQKSLNGKLAAELQRQGKGDMAKSMGDIMTAAAAELSGIKEDINKVNSWELFNSKSGNEGNISPVREVMLEGSTPKATEIKNRMEELKTACKQTGVDEDVKRIVESLMNTDNGADGKSWEETHFENVPVAGAEMMINKVEYDMWTAVNQTMAALAGNMETTDEEKAAEEKKDDSNLENTAEQLLSIISGKLDNMYGGRNAKGLKETFVMTEHKAPLFAGYENIVKVAAIKNNGEDAKVEVAAVNGKVEKRGGSFVVIPDTDADKLTLKVTAQGGDTGEYEYDVVPMPMPKPVLVYNAPNGETREYSTNIPLSKKELMSIKEIRLTNNGGIENNETVTGFDMMVMDRETGKTDMIHADGNRINNNMRNRLGNVKRGDRIIFMNINAKGKYSGERTLVSVNVAHM